MNQFYAVYHKGSGELVSVGDFVNDDTICICSHANNKTPGHHVGNDASGRPFGCSVDGCWHNYAVPTTGIAVRRSVRVGLEVDAVASATLGKGVGPTLWQDTGNADAPFVSDPLAADLVALPIDGPQPAGTAWNTKKLAFVPIPTPPVVNNPVDPMLAKLVGTLTVDERAALKASL